MRLTNKIWFLLVLKILSTALMKSTLIEYPQRFSLLISCKQSLTQIIALQDKFNPSLQQKKFKFFFVLKTTSFWWKKYQQQ